MSARVVSLHRDSHGAPYLALGSPHAYGVHRKWLHEALRPELSVLRVDNAARVTREVPRDEPYPHPETCAPFQDATGLGFTLRPRLPLVFVKTRRDTLLPDARTALAYARENESDFADVLAVVAEHAREILDPEVVRRHEGEAPLLFQDIAQPYHSFAEGFFSTSAGLYAKTGAGVSTIVGPPINRPAPLPIQTGVIQTDWHHHALFLVTANPSFEGRSLVIHPDQAIAQMYFVASEDTEGSRVEHSATEDGGEDQYEARWQRLSHELADRGEGIASVREGAASVSLDCLHCRVSVTQAAEGGSLPSDHTVTKTFLHPYKIMKLQQKVGGNKYE